MKKRRKKLVRRAQPRVKGQRRIPKYAGFLEEISRCIERDAIRFNCSESWVVATGMAAMYGINIMKYYETEVDYARRKLRRVK